MALVGVLAIAIGLSLVIAAVLAATLGTKKPAPAASAAAPGYQVVQSKGGELSFEAPLEWSTKVEVSDTAGVDEVVGAGAVSTSMDDFKAAETDGVVAVVTGPGASTSAAFAGATIGNSTVFCPPTHCTTGKPQEIDKQLTSPVPQNDSQFTFSEPASDNSAGELRYTIETAPPTRYVVVIVRARDPAKGTDVIEHAVGSLTLK